MTTDYALDIVREALMLTLLLSLPVLGIALIVGLSISILQAMTQIQEQTLTFVPKILAMGAVTIMAVPWMAIKIMEFATRMFSGQG
ncbi:flagellar biosynthesis protein FliQ [Mucisphaera calidilacus]|uniref:Flagellar biosynthetic protein FliQ n=1 Tax=Mucisphaera calidilacus TaxID=2527982 RepID=A0A518BYX0_9BACT|nr:flagellar biosynthesis protein FliQ [Mucisphaera calidilacus]QDU72169.1 Flagellar biosynthetic protein FliQ [Mucisphaera calidilacus]